MWLNMGKLFLLLCIFGNVRSDDDCAIALADVFVLEEPKWEQVGFGVSGQPVSVRITPVIPPKLQPCLQSWNVVTDHKSYSTKIISKAYPASTKFVDVQVKVREWYVEPISIVAHYNNGEGQPQVSLVSAQAKTDAENCGKERPDVQNLTVSQASPGSVKLSWDLKLLIPQCQDLYSYSIQQTFGYSDITIDDTGAKMIAIKPSDRDATLNIPIGETMVFRMVVAQGDHKEWYEDDDIAFRSTAGGGCGEDFRVPGFKGKSPKVMVSVVPNRQSGMSKVTVSWSHLEVENPDCVNKYMVEWFPTSDKYNDKEVSVPANQTQAVVDIKSTNDYGGKTTYQIQVAPAWHNGDWFTSDMEKVAATAIIRF